jgi:hypothetical protein
MAFGSFKISPTEKSLIETTAGRMILRRSEFGYSPVCPDQRPSAFGNGHSALFRLMAVAQAGITQNSDESFARLTKRAEVQSLPRAQARPAISETGIITLARESTAGRVVNNTHVTCDSGSCHTTVPVDP